MKCSDCVVIQVGVTPLNRCLSARKSVGHSSTNALISGGSSRTKRYGRVGELIAPPAYTAVAASP